MLSLLQESRDRIHAVTHDIFVEKGIVSIVQAYAEEFVVHYGLIGSCYLARSVPQDNGTRHPYFLVADVGPVGRGFQLEAVDGFRCLDLTHFQTVRFVRFDLIQGDTMYIASTSIPCTPHHPRLDCSAIAEPTRSPVREYQLSEVLSEVIARINPVTRNSDVSVCFGGGVSLFPGYPEEIFRKHCCPTAEIQIN